MVEAHWDDIRDRELRFGGQTWALTGDVEVRKSGATVAADAQRVDGSRGESTTLVFGLEDPPASLNPGNLGEVFSRIEGGRDGSHLVVETAGRTYRYRLQSRH